MSIIEWWGVCIQNKCPTHTDMSWSQLNANRYPVWASLAWDHLPVMASSVSSEHAFLSAGITICKRCSQLKPDIVKALQFIKCLYRQELLFREEPSTAFEGEEELFEVIGDAARGEEGAEGEKGWDGLVGDLQDNKGFQGFDADDVFVQTIL